MIQNFDKTNLVDNSDKKWSPQVRLCRYSHSTSRWFDNRSFDYWYQFMPFPKLKKFNGSKKVVCTIMKFPTSLPEFLNYTKRTNSYCSASLLIAAPKHNSLSFQMSEASLLEWKDNLKDGTLQKVLKWAMENLKPTATTTSEQVFVLVEYSLALKKHF